MRSRGDAFAVTLVVGVLAATAGVARAAGPSQSGSARSDSKNGLIPLAILDVRVSGTVEARRVEGLSHVLVAEASRVPELDVVTSADVRTMLGYEAERQLLQCDTDSSCIADIGGALGVSYLVVADVTRIGDVWLLTVNLLDLATARAARRSTRRVGEESALVDAASEALRDALTGVPGLDPSRLAAPAGRSTGRGWLAWTATGVGGAATLTGLAFYGSALATKLQWEEDRRIPRLSVTVEQARTAETLAPVGIGLAAAGAALIAGSFLLPAPEQGPVSVVVLPGRTPYAAVSLRLP